jgi:hypothetical protein
MSATKIKRLSFTGALVVASIEVVACGAPSAPSDDENHTKTEEALSGACTSGNVDCYRMYRPLSGYSILGAQHNFVGCVPCGMDPKTTLGSVYEDSWADSGTSSSCWSNTVNGSAYSSCYVTVGAKIGCVGNMGDAYAQTEQTMSSRCSWQHGVPGYMIADWDTANDVQGALYPSFPHTYLVNGTSPGAPSGYTGSYGHGPSNQCNCISWSNLFQSKLKQVNTNSCAPASLYCPRPQCDGG